MHIIFSYHSPYQLPKQYKTHKSIHGIWNRYILHHMSTRLNSNSLPSKIVPPKYTPKLSINLQWELTILLISKN
ncbi:Hypothetical predicted protein [Octopus vulgaris]|uniref:Uncharacterized protein n=1 Tax=Octopus vulgaris TaxID=6645 RepID=A0AA36AF52_OCTVU|nr:Hypothetical predicted protein [Octopus vulgaris]